MVIRFCQRQTEKGSPTSCCVFHNNCKIYEYRPVEAIQHVVFAAQEDHCYFYRKGTDVAAKTPTGLPARTTAYSCYKVREPFEPEGGRPYGEREPYWKLQPLAADGFRALRRPKRKHSNDEVRIQRETMQFFTKNNDLQGIYEELLAHQQ